MVPGLARWVKDLALLWLWHRLAAVAPIRLLAWEPPYAMCGALKKTKKKKKVFFAGDNGPEARLELSQCRFRLEEEVPSL